jgi:hypothetical protein
MPDRGAVLDHFTSTIAAYRGAAHAEKWKPLAIDTRQLGEHSVFSTVHWNAFNTDGKVVRDTWSSSQLLATPDGLHFSRTQITSEPGHVDRPSACEPSALEGRRRRPSEPWPFASAAGRESHRR